MSREIPFNRPFIVGKELTYISEAVAGGHLAGNGRFTKLCQEWLERTTGSRKAMLTHSCTGALEMAAILAGIKPGDQVIVPSYGFVTTANAFVLRGADIRFVDIREDTLNVDERLIEKAVTNRTRAIVPIHYAGVACEINAIMAIAERHGLVVVEDAAQAVDAGCGGRHLGAIGHFGTFSFHETKNFISGEGGALLVNDDRFIERAEIIWEKGTDREKFLRGEVDKYTWVDIGSSFLPSELVAAFLYAQLEETETITRKRRYIFDFYFQHLADLEAAGCLRRPVISATSDHNAHMFFVLLNDEPSRAKLIKHLAADGIQAVFHYIPLHLSPMGRQFGYKPGDLPVTEDLAARVLRLPCFFELATADQERIVASLYRFFDM